jgi:hypothetical protein
MQSWKVGVKTRQEPKADWAYNGLRFEHHSEAQTYATILRMKWLDVIQTVVHTSQDPVNTTYPVPSDRYPVHRD